MMKCIRLHSKYTFVCWISYMHNSQPSSMPKTNLAAREKKNRIYILVTFRIIILTQCFGRGNSSSSTSDNSTNNILQVTKIPPLQTDHLTNHSVFDLFIRSNWKAKKKRIVLLHSCNQKKNTCERAIQLYDDISLSGWVFSFFFFWLTMGNDDTPCLGCLIYHALSILSLLSFARSLLRFALFHVHRRALSLQFSSPASFRSQNGTLMPKLNSL